jgi:hypothetical protein
MAAIRSAFAWALHAFHVTGGGAGGGGVGSDR